MDLVQAEEVFPLPQPVSDKKKQAYCSQKFANRHHRTKERLVSEGHVRRLTNFQSQNNNKSKGVDGVALGEKVL